MCWLPQLSNQLGYMFALIFEIYASAMFFCAHQLFDQLNAGKEMREMKFCHIYALVGCSQEKKYQLLIIWLLGLKQRLSFCFWYCFVCLFLFQLFCFSFFFIYMHFMSSQTETIRMAMVIFICL